MLLINACIAGGVVYAGLKTFVKWRPTKKTAWLVKLDSRPQRDALPASEAGSMELDETTTSRSLTIASVSMGLSMSGALLYAPLSLASVPLTVYGTIPIFERTYSALFKEGRMRLAVVQSIVIVGSLASQHYVLASFITWLHYCLALLAHRFRHGLELSRRMLETNPQFMDQVRGAKRSSVWVMARHGVGMEIPIENLRIGDIVIANEGEVVPVEGTIVEGTAKVSLLLATGEARLVTKGVGDRVAPSTVVWSGKICLRVDRL